MLKRDSKGFTLIELLIVVAIIGIIAAIAIPNLLNAIDRGKQKRTMADMRSIGTAMESFAVDNNVYPVAATPAALEDDRRDRRVHEDHAHRRRLAEWVHRRLRDHGVHAPVARQARRERRLRGRYAHDGVHRGHLLPERAVHPVPERWPAVRRSRSMDANGEDLRSSLFCDAWRQ